LKFVDVALIMAVVLSMLLPQKTGTNFRLIFSYPIPSYQPTSLPGHTAPQRGTDHFTDRSMVHLCSYEVQASGYCAIPSPPWRYPPLRSLTLYCSRSNRTSSAVLSNITYISVVCISLPDLATTEKAVSK